MDWMHAVILGLIQGITEFLPISSSGHLIIAPRLFGWTDQGLLFDVAANTGSLLAVVFYFRKELHRLLVGFFRTLKKDGFKDNPDGLLAWWVGFATIPAGIAGLLFKGQVATVARDPKVIAVTAIVFGLLLWWADHIGQRKRSLGDLTLRDALVIGVAQAVALIPGTSRSGITMTAGLFLGLNRETAAKFSFLLVVPIGFLAGSLEMVETIRQQPSLHEWGILGLGVIVSAITAFVVIHWLLSWLRTHSMTVFVVYRLFLGAFIFFSLVF